MKNWRKELGLIEVRKMPATDRGFWAEQERYTYLSAEVAIETIMLRELPPWLRAAARAAAAGLTADRAVVAGKAAARLWGIEILGWHPTVELMYAEGRNPGSRRNWPRGVEFRYCQLDEAEVYTAHGLRVTGVLRTLRDITRYHGLLDGVVAMDSARRRWPALTRQRLREELLTVGPYHGKALVKRAIRLSVADAGSPLESKARFLLTEAALPQIAEIQTQARITHQDGYFEVDLLVNGWLIIEVDGEVKYDGVTFGVKPEKVVLAERRREKLLQNSGKVVLRVGHRDLICREDGGCSFLDLVENALVNFAAPHRL